MAFPVLPLIMYYRLSIRMSMSEPAHNPIRPAGYRLPVTMTIPPFLQTDDIWPSALWNAMDMRAIVHVL